MAKIAGDEGSGFVCAHALRHRFMNECNESAMGLYGSMGGIRPNDDDVMWDFEYAGS